ncbi:MAG: hypothetical protein HY961_14870 [Ignavibacteriae bacterium]|nr:hypothetical protein [Ignavibacteriota bacterium]
MIRISGVCTLFLLSSTLLFAAEPARRFTNEYEIRRDLFAQTSSFLTPSMPSLQTQDVVKRKSPALAALYSLLVPGLGEYYADGFGSGRFFLIAEGAFWLTYATFDIYGAEQRGDSRAFATTHAGIVAAGKDDQFFVDIGNFANTQEFNDKRLRERNLERVYNDPAYRWSWDSEASRLQFKDVRNSGENALNNRKFVVSAIIINHIASAINAARCAISYNKNIEQQSGALQFKADVLGGWANPHGIVLTVSKSF